MRITLSDIRNSRIPPSIGLCAEDARVAQIANECVQRLLPKGHWWGATQRFRFCTTDACVTMPRQIASLEGIAICGRPVTLRNQYFEFLETGAGIQGGRFVGESGSCCNFSCGPSAVIFRGTVATQTDITGTNKKLRAICDLASDVGKEVLFLGFDQDNNWIRSNQGGTIKDGEIVVLSQSPGTDSVNLFSSVTDVQPPDDLDGQWWVYSLNTDDSTLILLSHYQYDETRPVYNRYLMPICPRSNSNGDCAQTLVDAIGKLAYIPMRADTDYCIIGNIPALKAGCEAINLSEHEPDGIKKVAIMEAGMAEAVKLLNEELQANTGDKTVPGIQVFNFGIGGNDFVPALL